jgi:hypothetical protein
MIGPTEHNAPGDQGHIGSTSVGCLMCGSTPMERPFRFVGALSSSGTRGPAFHPWPDPTKYYRILYKYPRLVLRESIQSGLVILDDAGDLAPDSPRS